MISHDHTEIQIVIEVS